jgi:hypothetical protein
MLPVNEGRLLEMPFTTSNGGSQGAQPLLRRGRAKSFSYASARCHAST